MAELLIRVHDKINADFYLNCQCAKRGDVIVICEDDWGWSAIERTTAEWRILRAPESAADLSGLLAPEPATHPTRRSRTLQRRQFHLDLDRMTGPLKQYIDDDSRAAPLFALAAGEIGNYHRRRPPIADPSGAAPDWNIF